MELFFHLILYGGYINSRTAPRREFGLHRTGFQRLRINRSINSI